MTLRDQRQKEFADKWLETKFGILYLCPRFGKIKTAINCLEAFTKPKVLIIYPIETIKTSWTQDLVKWGYDNPDIIYSTTASLWKLSEKPELYDVIIVDEIHALSPANLEELKVLMEHGNKVVLGLSGTLSERTQAELSSVLRLPVVAYYPIEQGIKEKVITDYEITVLLTNLDNKVKYIRPYKNGYVITEQEQYDKLTAEMSKRQMSFDPLSDDPLDLGMLPLLRMHVLKQSISKLSLTKRLIAKYKDERLLIFCGTTDNADKLGIPSYHSKNKNEVIKTDFCNGSGSHLATVDMFEAGVTIKPINRAIINAFDSNPENLSQRISRLTGFEYDNLEKVAKVYIISTETIELKWLKKALEFFDTSKVKYVKII